LNRFIVHLSSTGHLARAGRPTGTIHCVAQEDETMTVRGASVKDVALAAGVSLGTVSNVLNRPDRVTEKTRSRVERAMRELGFVRNESARQLRLGRSRTLAYVMLDARNPFFTDVAAGIDDAAEAAELSLFLCNSDNRARKEAEHLEHLEQQRVQGILITPVDPSSPLLTTVAQRGTPIVVVDRSSTGTDLCTVAVDDVLGGRLAVEHLIDQGHERMAYIGGPFSIGQVADRHEGAKAAWLAAGRREEDFVVLAT
jgi:LacI family transcriptional regulator